MKVDVTVALTVYNAEKYIYSCIESLLSQTFKNFEIVIVEDPPFDQTKNIIHKFNDKRIRYFRNQKHLGLSKSRNISVKLAKGNYIFFTDDDCIAAKDWIEQGLKTFHNLDCIGVEGKIYYVNENYKPTFSDGTYIRHVKKGGGYHTINIAYKKSIIKGLGGFDERYTYLEDRDLGLRAKELGKIIYNPYMLIYHQKITLTPKQFIKTSKRIRNRVLLYKKFGVRARIVNPKNLLILIFPPLIFGSFFTRRYRTKEDFILFPYIYIKVFFERLNLWDMCIKERVFLI